MSAGRSDISTYSDFRKENLADVARALTGPLNQFTNFRSSGMRFDAQRSARASDIGENRSPDSPVGPGENSNNHSPQSNWIAPGVAGRRPPEQLPSVQTCIWSLLDRVTFAYRPYASQLDAECRLASRGGGMGDIP